MGGYATNPDTNATSEITGSGTANYMAKFTAAQVIGNSTVQDDGTTVSTTSKMSVGNYATPTNLRQFTVGQDTAWIAIGSVVGATSRWSIYGNQTTPSTINYALSGTSSQTRLNATSDIILRISDATVINLDANSQQYTTFAKNNTTVTAFTFTSGNNTLLTASTNQPIFNIASSTQQFATGALTSQYFTHLPTQTLSFAAASTATNVYGLFVEAATAGTNATITRNYSLGTDGNVAFGVGSGGSSIWLGVTATATNYFGYADNSSTYLNGGVGASTVQLRTGGAIRFITNGAFTTGAINAFRFLPAAMTGQTASTEIQGLTYESRTMSWLAGNITTQREFHIQTQTYAFASASTITNSYGLYVEAATAGANATITNNYAAGFSGGSGINIQTGSLSGNGITLGNLSGSTNQTALYMGVVPSSTNYALRVDSTGTNTFLNGSQIFLVIGATSQMIMDGNSVLFQSFNTSASGAKSAYTFSPTSNTSQTASTEISGYLYNSYSRQWATGAITTQRERYYKTVTYTAVGASTITKAYGMYVEAPTASTNITITNNFALGLTGNLQLQDTTSSTTGVVFKGTNRFMHNFTPSGSNGRNLFVGQGAGNFTASWASGPEASANTGLGYIALQSLTNGAFNNCIGAQSGQLITTGNYNNLQGYYTGGELVGGGANVAIGESSLRFGDGSYNVGVGYRALFGTTGNSYNNNVAIGAHTGYNLTTGSNNIFIGYSATTGGITSGAQNILIGYQISPQSVSANGQLSIGNLIFGQGISATGTSVSSGTVGIGIVAVTTAILSLAAGTTAKSQINFESSTAPSSPVNGDLWFDGTDLKIRVSGVTYTLTKD